MLSFGREESTLQHELSSGCPLSGGTLASAQFTRISPLLILFLFFKILFILFGVQLINNVVLVSGVQQSDLVIHIHVSILLQILFPFRLLHNMEQSSLCYTVGPCWLSILNIIACIYQSQTPNLSLPPTFPPLVTINLFSKSVSLFLFCR